MSRKNPNTMYADVLAAAENQLSEAIQTLLKADSRSSYILIGAIADVAKMVHDAKDQAIQNATREKEMIARAIGEGI